MNTISTYLGGVVKLIDEVDPNAVTALTGELERAWRSGSKVLLMGNGGSAATASHFANDFQKCIQTECGRGVRALSLTDCGPLVMAWGNDTEYDNIFAPQVECWAGSGDLVIGISGSGNSMNVINGIETANRLGAITFGLAGCGGGKLAQAAQHCIVVGSHNMQQIEDLHSIILHAAFTELREKVRAGQ